MSNVVRKYSGPNGSWNYLPDNGSIELERDVDGNVELIRITSPTGDVYEKTITRDIDGNVSEVSEWVQL